MARLPSWMMRLRIFASDISQPTPNAVKILPATNPPENFPIYIHSFQWCYKFILHRNTNNKNEKKTTRDNTRGRLCIFK
jgi:hypothetical protein